MIWRKKSPRYNVETLGALIVEKVQSPHSLHEVDGSEYKITTWTYRLRVDNGPIFFERTYASGKQSDIEKMSQVIRYDRSASNETTARWAFYEQLGRFFNSRYEV